MRIADVADAAHTWELERDEFGRPIVRHRHPLATILAYVTTDADGVKRAWCPTCSQRIDLSALESQAEGQ